MSRIVGLLRSKRTFFLYCAIGASGVACDFIVYSMLLGLGILGYQLANAGGYIVGTVLSFTLNARYNFKVSNRLAGRFLLFASVALVGYTVSVVGLHILIEWFHLDRYSAKASVLILVVLIQYNLNRHFSFRSTT